MIIVKVELHSAVTGKTTELARMMIANVGGTDAKGNYECVTYRGKSKDALDKAQMAHHVSNGQKGFTRTGEVKDHPRWAEHVWNLVAKALVGMGYGEKALKLSGRGLVADRSSVGGNDPSDGADDV